MSLIASGCITELGYYPQNIKVKNLGKGQKDPTNLLSTYPQVKAWAYDVQDGLDARATINHYADDAGAIMGLAAAGAMVGLAAFDSSSPVLKGLPIGAAFGAGVAAYSANAFKYDMYSRASAYVRALITISDARMELLLPARGTQENIEAMCLKERVDSVLTLVSQHIVRMDPANLVAELKAIQPGVDQQKLVDLVKAAQNDLSDLNIPTDLRMTYCSGMGQPLPDFQVDEKGLVAQRPLLIEMQMKLESLVIQTKALDSALEDAKTVQANLKGKALTADQQKLASQLDASIASAGVKSGTASKQRESLATEIADYSQSATPADIESKGLLVLAERKGITQLSVDVTNTTESLKKATDNMRTAAPQ